jgi:hypothetical protein
LRELKKNLMKFTEFSVKRLWKNFQERNGIESVLST